MAFNYDIRNLKNCSDFKSKREDFFKTLRLQAKLNRNYEQATIAREQMDSMGITPVAQARRSLEDERKDLILQQQLAMKNLQSIMKDDEASAVIQALNEADVYFLNSEFGRLTEYLKGRTNISADFFKRVLARFKVYLESTGMTGIPIPLRESTIEKLPGDLKDAWDNYARQTIDPTTGKPYDIDELIRRTAEATQRAPEDVKMEVDDEIKMEAEQSASAPSTAPTPEPVAEPETRGTKRRTTFNRQTFQYKEPRVSMAERVAKRQRDEMEMEMPEGKKARTKGEFKRRISPVADAQEDYVPYDANDASVPINPNTRGVKRGREAVPMPNLPEKRTRFEDESAVMKGVKRQADEAIDLQAQKFAATGGLSLEQARRLARAQIEARQRMYLPPTRVVNAQPDVGPRMTGRKRGRDDIPGDVVERPQKFADWGTLTVAQARTLARSGIEARAEQRAAELGSGLFVSPQRPTSDYGPPTVFSTLNLHGGKMGKAMRKNGKIIGSGLAGQGQERYREFGKYALHMPSIQESYISVRYLSNGKAVASIPQKYVSKDFVKLIGVLLDENLLDKAMFNKLNAEEQQYLRMLGNKCEFGQSIGLGVSSHLTDSEQKEQDRFEMLRGTIIAGNNSPEVLKEMKMFILKFINEKKIPKTEGHDLLYEIACLS